MATSSAIRIHTIVAALSSDDKSSNVQVAFATHFGIDPTQTHQFHDEVSNAIGDFRDELAIADEQLYQIGVPETLRAPPIEAARQLTSPPLLAASWRSHRDNYLGRHIVVAWAWAAFVVPADGQDISEEDLTQLIGELAELEAIASKASMPQSLRSYISRQTTRVRDALRRSKIRGLAPLKEAASVVIVDTLREASTLAKAVQDKAAGEAAAHLRATFVALATVTGDAETFRNLTSGNPQLAYLAPEDP